MIPSGFQTAIETETETETENPSLFKSTVSEKGYPQTAVDKGFR